MGGVLSRKHSDPKKPAASERQRQVQAEERRDLLAAGEPDELDSLLREERERRDRRHLERIRDTLWLHGGGL